MARITIFALDDMTPEQRTVHDAIASGPRGGMRGPFQAAIHRPELALRWQQFGELLRYGTVFPPRLSELAIIVTARRWNSAVEWQIHSEIALREGLSQNCVTAIKRGEVPVFDSQDDADIYEFCREILNHGTVRAETHDRIRKRWNEVGAVELTALVGYYSLVAMTLNAHELPPPSGMVPDLPSSTSEAGDLIALADIPPLASSASPRLQNAGPRSR
jgi:4-carboxymuconolactone decarboxylase